VLTWNKLDEIKYAIFLLVAGVGAIYKKNISSIIVSIFLSCSALRCFFTGVFDWLLQNKVISIYSTEIAIPGNFSQGNLKQPN